MSNTNFRRQSLFSPLASRRMFNDMLSIEPWTGNEELPLVGRSFERDLMASLLDVSPPVAPVVHIAPPHFSPVFVQILEPLALLERMDRMISKWIGGKQIRRPTAPFRIRRNIKAGRRGVRAIRRNQPVQPQQPFMRRSVSVNQPMQQRQFRQGRSVQPTWQQPRVGSNIAAWKQPQQFPVTSFGGRQQQPEMPIMRQPFGGQQQFGRSLPIQGVKTGVKQSNPSLGRQVPIQSQSGVNQPKRSNIGKMAEPVTGVKLPQLYRICLDAQGCNPKDIKCNVQKTTAGQCNMIITGCGPYKRCYTLPNMCDHKKMKKYVTRENMCVIECPLLEESPRCLDICTQPQIREDSVCLKVAIPEFIDPNKVEVNLRGTDLILRFETKCTSQECCTRVHYYNKVTLPRDAQLDMLKCQCVKGCLLITAPISGKKQQAGRPVSGKVIQPKQMPRGEFNQPQKKQTRRGEVVKREESEVRGPSTIQPEKKMRHKKLLKLQQQGGSIQQKGVQPTTKPVPGQKSSFKLPKPEEIGGVSKQSKQSKQTRKTSPVTKPVTKQQPKTTEKKEKKERRPESPRKVQEGEVQPKKQGKKPMKELKEGQKPESGISGSQQLHEIFGSSGKRSPTGEQEQHPQERPQEQTPTTSESMGRPASPTKL